MSLFKTAPLEGGDSGAAPGPPAAGVGATSGAGPAGAGGELTGASDGVILAGVGAAMGGIPAGGDAVGDAFGGAGTGDGFGATVGAVAGDCAMAEPTNRSDSTRAATVAVAEPILLFLSKVLYRYS